MLKRAKDMAVLVVVSITALTKNVIADNLSSNITAQDLGDRMVDAFVMAMQDTQMLTTMFILIAFSLLMIVIYSLVGGKK